MPPILDDATVRSYLLGEMPENRAEALEDQYFDDPELLSEVRGVEHDLIDDYVACRLVGRERTLFEGRYLATPAQRERVLAASALRLVASDLRAAPSDGRFRGRAARTPRFRLWPVLGSIAALLLMSLSALQWWWPRTASPHTPSPPVIARAESPVPVASATLAVVEVPRTPRAQLAVFVLALAPVLTRGEGEPPQVRLPPRTAEVLVEFQGEPGSLPVARRLRLSVVLTTVEGRQVWAGVAQARAEGTRPALLASARLPAAALKADDYIATLSIADGPDEVPPYRYFFRVVH